MRCYLGAYIYCRDGGSLVPGFQAERIGDTNGAGDSFWGGFLYKISTSEKRLQELAKEELVEYARFGNAVASLCAVSYTHLTLPTNSRV